MAGNGGAEQLNPGGLDGRPGGSEVRVQQRMAGRSAVHRMHHALSVKVQLCGVPCATCCGSRCCSAAGRHFFALRKPHLLNHIHHTPCLEVGLEVRVRIFQLQAGPRQAMSSMPLSRNASQEHIRTQHEHSSGQHRQRGPTARANWQRRSADQPSAAPPGS